MNEELKPVKCGCGGEARIETDHDTVVPGDPIDWKRVVCHNCNIRTTWRHTEAEAVQAWNLAMVERTAKVNPLETGLHTVWGTCECGRQVEKPGKNYQRGAYYCPHCGARLEWE